MISELAAFSALIFFTGMMVYAGVMDLTTMTIRNRLVIGLFVGYCILAPLAGFGLPEIGMSFGVAAAVLVLTFALFSFGWIGGGDAKLAAVTALWLGADQTIAYLLYTALFGGVLAVALLEFRLFALPSRLQGMAWVSRLHSSQIGLPYGVAMAPAALFVFPNTPWLSVLT